MYMNNHIHICLRYAPYRVSILPLSKSISTEIITGVKQAMFGINPQQVREGTNFLQLISCQQTSENTLSMITQQRVCPSTGFPLVLALYHNLVIKRCEFGAYSNLETNLHQVGFKVFQTFRSNPQSIDKLLPFSSQRFGSVRTCSGQRGVLDPSHQRPARGE